MSDYSVNCVSKKEFMNASIDLKKKKAIILVVIVVVAFIFGRLAVRAVGCLLLGGTMFGGNVL